MSYPIDEAMRRHTAPLTDPASPDAAPTGPASTDAAPDAPVDCPPAPRPFAITVHRYERYTLATLRSLTDAREHLAEMHTAVMGEQVAAAYQEAYAAVDRARSACIELLHRLDTR